MGRRGLALCALCALLHWQPGRSVRLQSPRGPGAGGPARRSAGEGGKGRLRPGRSPTNCSLIPGACQPPFDCQLRRDERPTYATPDGHADFSTWCPTPYKGVALQCQRGHLRRYASLMHLVQKEFEQESFDEHYCFGLGYCDDTEIDENTTLAEMEELCDRRFGHSAWTQLRRFTPTDSDAVSTPYGPILTAEAERRYALMSCGMGNYHCDHVYCKLEYCRNPVLRARWSSDRARWSSDQAAHQ